MYNLEISELKWKHRPGPTGDTCSISITCSVPVIDRTQLLIRSEQILDVASVIANAYHEIIISSMINDNTYTAELDGIITQNEVELLLVNIETLSITILNESVPESDADPNIFVYHAIDQADPIYNEDLFACIASKYDMDTLPVGEPIALEDLPAIYEAIPFYRIDHVDMDFLTASAAHRFVRVVQSDTKKLVQEIIDAGKHLESITVHI